MNLTRITRRFFNNPIKLRKLKETKPESYLKTQTDTNPHIKEEIFDEIELITFNKQEYVRGLREDEKPMPISPAFGPISMDGKRYYFNVVL